MNIDGLFNAGTIIVAMAMAVVFVAIWRQHDKGWGAMDSDDWRGIDCDGGGGD